MVMPNVASSVSVRVAQRWQEIDPLLPEPGSLRPGCGAEFIVTGAGGRPAAIGRCEHREIGPGSLDLAWSVARRFQLTVRIAGSGIAADLDRLLSLWHDHLAGVPGTGDEDTAAVVNWPSRDIGGVATLQRRGFAPLEVIAARKTGRHPAGPAGTGLGAGTVREDVVIRRAGPADVDAVVCLGMGVVRFDAHFIGLSERPDTADALRREAAKWLGPPSWTWLAERDGTAVGMLNAQRPEAAGWIAPMVRPAPAAYLNLMFVQPGERGGGVGAAMVSRLHREIGDAGVAVTLLHYAQLNPLSVPFWSRQGYRPLWTGWEARPASAIR